jgi:restriction system protein
VARSFGSTVNKMIKETAKAQRAAERSRNAAIREQERHLRLQRQYERENERAIKQSIREQKVSVILLFGKLDGNLYYFFRLSQ